MLSANPETIFKVGRQDYPPTPITKPSAPVAEKRKTNKTPTYNMTYDQIQDLKAQAALDAVSDLLTLTLGLPAMVLHDKHGWREAELNQFVDDVAALFDSYEKGYIRLDDCVNTLKEEAGIKNIVIHRKGRDEIL